MNQGFSQFIVFVVSSAFAQEVLKLRLESDKSIPIVGENLILSCLTHDIFKDGVIYWHIPNVVEHFKCYSVNGGVCERNTSSYSFTANSSGAYAYIAGLDRARDRGTWKCMQIDAKYNNANATMGIVIYTSPIAVNLVQPIPIDGDLGMESITLMCQTLHCAFPAPNIIWYYMTDGAIAPFIGFSDKKVTRECPRQEAVYTSTLHLPRGTNFSGNIPLTAKFLCGVTHPSLGEETKYSNVSNDVIFAVHVSNVNILDSENGTNVFYEGFPQTLKCVSSRSRPVPIIRWFLRTNNAFNSMTCITNNITERNTSDINGLHVTESEITLIPKRDQIYKIFCVGNIYGQQAVESKLVEIDVLYQADQPYVSELGRKFPWLENQTGILSCNTSNNGNPPSQVIWFSHRDMNGTHLIITKLTSNDNGKLAFCQLVNKYTVDKNTTVKSPPVTLVIECMVLIITDSPVIEMNITSPLTLNETQSISVLCTATGNPSPDPPTWTRQSSSTLRFENVNRNDSGTYTCSVRAKSETNGDLTNQKEIHIHVQYAPDINLTITGSDHMNMTSNLTCEANGFPTNYKFHPWKHMFGNVTIRSNLQSNTEGLINSTKNILTLKRLSLQDMGTYTCSADNGIRGANGDVIQTSAAVLNVKGKPEIVNRKHDTFAGAIGSSVNIYIAFYSDPVITDFKFQRDGSNIENTSRTNMYLSTNVVELLFHNTNVKLAVLMANLLIQNLTADDFDGYNLVLENALGKTDFKLQLYPSGT
ncbi:hypothetical protein CHS0354_013684 [Potamilus streckersoni]|uniref:Ig-like domain-containing protein n=1 Tax=Potamilus streckersoni TaxID=2493646 RepID=A0AAE0SFZ7_9BIVA|nr:hypothetical protein CHS0354_013684 [Potamilus streckersoni]